MRGEHYEMATTGVYAYNALRVVAEGIGWDIFTLLFAVPALLMALPSLAKGSLRGRLFALGILGYLFYQYLMYAMTWAFGPLLLFFVVIYALSLAAIVGIVSTIPLTGLAERFSERFPRRGMALLCFLLATLLLFMWLSLILSASRGEIQGVLHGQTTFVVQALDLGLIVPLALFTGVTVWRGSAIGYLLGSTLVVKAFAMAAAICAMLLSAWAFEGTLEIVPFVVFATAAGVTVWLGIRMYRSVLPAPPGAPMRSSRISSPHHISAG
ncbi:MAG TPA: hypothetical protein DEP84_34310 [Chloroflexi bacterium]|nr:hypothetical protein [Chloroflexota bacterium]